MRAVRGAQQGGPWSPGFRRDKKISWGLGGREGGEGGGGGIPNYALKKALFRVDSPTAPMKIGSVQEPVVGRRLCGHGAL